MSGFSPTSAAASGGASNVITSDVGRTPHVVNLALDAGVEQGFLFPDNTVGYILKYRGFADLLVAYQPGGTAGIFWTVPSKCFYSESSLNTVGVTVYLLAPVSGVCELVYWT